MTRRDEIIGEIAECAHKVAHAMEDSATHEWLRLDLTMAQLKGLFVLGAAAPITVGALAQRLAIHFSAASHVADRLVQVGLAERYEDPEDRRRTFLRLTARGDALVGQLRQGRREQFHEWIGALSDEDLAALHQGLRAFAMVLATRC